MTLDEWSRRFEANVDQVRAMFSEEFVRMWRLYLRGSSACFREGSCEVHQTIVSHGIARDLPLTRDDLSATSGAVPFEAGALQELADGRCRALETSPPVAT
jgi:cyclopropane-fatty-acyl-phospholipid synthase